MTSFQMPSSRQQYKSFKNVTKMIIDFNEILPYHQESPHQKIIMIQNIQPNHAITLKNKTRINNEHWP